MQPRKKILILMEWFLPGFKAGGPIQSCFNLSQVLNKDFDIYILTTDTDHTESQPYLNVVVNQWFKHAEWSVYIYYLKSHKYHQHVQIH
jgi:hypothetical protein